MRKSLRNLTSDPRPTHYNQTVSAFPSPHLLSLAHTERQLQPRQPHPRRSAMSVETERSSTESSAASGLDFEDTALTLTLRLPGSASSSSSSSSSAFPDPDHKRPSSDADADRSSPIPAAAESSDAPPAPKARVVGWPPVRSYRKNALADVAGSCKAKQAAKFVKVAVDGAPYLRKVDLEAYAGYDQLLRALQDKFFSHFTIRKFADDERKLVDAVNGTEYVPTYEDKDGDWMLVGDVPWK
ncbi:hypothetical protein SETIT_5G126200v2 [Setaria italica]|nr:hypothetical protein SETIT_5G126200v2 [Setaria italica]